MLSINQEDPLGILSSTKYVVENARSVTLEPGAVAKIARKVEEKILAALPRGEEAFGTFTSLEQKAQFAFVVDSVNFCFCAEQGKPKWQVEWPPGQLVYSPALAEKVDNYVLIPAGSKEEAEIRAATVWGVELIRQVLVKYPAGVIDNAIWYISQDQAGLRPYHRTYTIFY